MKSTVIYQLKGKNARITVLFFECKEKKKEPLIIVKTKRLNSFKLRVVSESEVIYSIETFIVLSEVFNHLLKDNTYIKKKINPYSKVEKWKCNLIIRKLNEIKSKK